MKGFLKILTFFFSTTLMVLGLLYIIDKEQEKRIGGKLVKVNYQFSKEFS